MSDSITGNARLDSRYSEKYSRFNSQPPSSRLHPHRLERIEKAFNKTSNTLLTIRDTHFLIINSMTMGRDGCYFCENAEHDILQIAAQLKCAKEKTKSGCRHVTKKLPFYSRPILLQHFPTYRKSDVACIERDAPEIEVYREDWEVLSKNATNFLAKHLNPRVAFSGHSHHYCHTHTTWDAEEYTLASFSWRNKNNPSFLLVGTRFFFILIPSTRNGETDKTASIF